jgi:hypothetical protein
MLDQVSKLSARFHSAYQKREMIHRGNNGDQRTTDFVPRRWSESHVNPKFFQRET